MPITRREVLKGGVGAGVLAASSFSPLLQGVAHASTQPYLGEIMIFAGTFAPRGWAFCDGQLLAVSQFDALFSLVGTTYGGDGRTTFALPDLRGRVPVHQSSTYRMGQKGGAEAVTLTPDNLPVHKHRLRAASSKGTSSSPAGNVWATATGSLAPYVDRRGVKREEMLTDVLAPAGGGAAHNNMLPYLGLHYCIALYGIYPSRH